MAIFASAYVIEVDLPYSQFWLPLLIGMGVGVVALTACKLVGGRKKAAPVKVEEEQPKSDPDHDPFTQGSTSEQRKSFRRQGNPTQVNIALPHRKDAPLSGVVVDRSVGGLCLHVSDEIAPGTTLSVIPLNAPAIAPWVDIEVKTCRKIRDTYELGCQFVKTPNWSILLMFG